MSVVVKQKLWIAVHVDEETGAIEITQQEADEHSPMQFIEVDPEDVPALVEALKRAAGL